jgi:lambda family phage portal protein
MNWLDSTIGYFSPLRGARRARARQLTRVYEGATWGRRGSSWKAIGTSANTELQSSIRQLRDRSRDLARNSAYATRMLDIMVSHSIGNGIVPMANTGGDKLDNQINSLWHDFTNQCDVTHTHQTFYAQQALATRSMIESGDVVVRFIDEKFDPANKTIAVPLRLQVLEADFIDHYREGVFATANQQFQQAPKNIIRNRLGVGLGKYDAWEGLWLWPRHPGEMQAIIDLRNYVSEFVERSELIHMFKRDRPGQVRGVPWFAPILMTARDLADYVDAINVKAKTEACFAGFITNSDESMPLLDDTTPSGMEMADMSLPNAMWTTLEPGMLKELRTGQDIKFASPTTTSQVEPILLFNLQAMAAGVGCTYDQATGDLRQANYSSLRAGKIEFWRLVGMLQRHTIIPQFCQPVWERFQSRAILAGRLPAPIDGRYYAAKWVVPAKEMIDPKKDFDAMKNMVRAGGTTPQEFIASFGGDWKTLIDDFKDFFAMTKQAGVLFDIDVAHVDQHGRQPAKGGAGGGVSGSGEDLFGGYVASEGEYAAESKDEGDEKGDEEAA